MRNTLEYLEESNNIEVINNIISGFFKLRGAVDKDNLDVKKAKELLLSFREVVGSDPIENEIKKRDKEQLRKEHQTNIKHHKSNKQKLEDLNIFFQRLVSTTEYTNQQRGYRLEDLLCDLLQLSELDYSRPYKTPDGEQIDGHFKYEKFDYLIETKWEKDVIKQKDLSIFDGKIRGKAQSTRGLFLSANGFDNNAVMKFSGDSPRVILMTGEDLAIILSARVSFYDAMKAKVEAIVRYGNINFPIRDL